MNIWINGGEVQLVLNKKQSRVFGNHLWYKLNMTPPFFPWTPLISSTTSNVVLLLEKMKPFITSQIFQMVVWQININLFWCFWFKEGFLNKKNNQRDVIFFLYITTHICSQPLENVIPNRPDKLTSIKHIIFFL